jgi:hypothetical protein
MRVTWKKQQDLRLTTAFVLSLLFGGRVVPPPLNPNKPSDITGFDDESLRLIVDEGRRQSADQSDRFKHATDRAQVLLTAGLAALGLVAALLATVNDASGARRVVATVVWAIAGVLTVLGVATAASVIVVRADFVVVDTTQMTSWSPPLLKQLADDYADAVILGETTVAARITVFRQATRFVCWGVVLAAIAFALTVGA